MTKSDFIAKYGEEAYERKLEYTRNWKTKGKKPRPAKNQTSCVVYYPTPPMDMTKARNIRCTEMREVVDRIAYVLQERTKKEYRSPQQHIIIVDAQADRKGMMPYKAELYQLNLTAEDEQRFKDAFNKVFKEWSETDGGECS